MYLTIPAVFAVEDTYQIMVRALSSSVMWIKIGDKCFYDHSNGILRSDVDVHRITVPAYLLDEHGSYTVCQRAMLERKPYFSETGEIEETEYKFYPVKGTAIRAYHIADAHNAVDAPVKAAEAYGKFDFLILNGDIPDHSGEVKNFDNIYELCGRITGGSMPIVFSRGNHDMRGVCAEKLEQYTPSFNGKSYFTVKLGGFWGMVLDCAEDKLDTNPEYGNTVCCHAFRSDETVFIENTVKDNKYSDSTVFCKAIIAHSPFTRRFEPPFDIEEDTYNKWTQLLNNGIKPDILISGHTHEISVDKPGSPNAVRGQGFPCVTASETNYKDYFAGAGFEFTADGKIHMTVTDSNGQVKEKYAVK